MDKIEALERIRDSWQNDTGSLGDKIIEISSCFYSAGLDLDSTAAFIKATPAELDFLLAMGEFEDEMISMISEADPPKTTWPLLASANDEEIRHALEAIKKRHSGFEQKSNTPLSEIVYRQMLEISGPTPEQRIQSISGQAIRNALKKGQDFKALTDKEVKFLKSISIQKTRGKTLTPKQISWLKDILSGLVTKNVITRDSIDGDQDLCDEILDALE